MTLNDLDCYFMLIIIIITDEKIYVAFSHKNCKDM